MDVFAELQQVVIDALEPLISDGVIGGEPPLDAVKVELPRDPNHGDFSTNAAMVLAKAAGMAPRALGEELAARLRASENVAAAEVAGPGFVNLSVAPGFWSGVISAIDQAGGDFGRSDSGAGRKVNVEYVSVNPTGPLHVGHCRGAVFGDTLANLLAFTGHDVCREYYINDAGSQVDVLARSAYLRYREACGEDIGEIPSGLYPGDYLKPVGRDLKERFGDSLLGQPEDAWLTEVRDIAIAAMMDLIRDDLAALNIRHDVFFSERSMIAGDVDKVAETIAYLREKGLVYEGRLPPPKGQLPDDWEDREQTLFRATTFGDDVDRPLAKSDGTYTYFASDMAYHRDKFLRGFATMIDVWGADHAGYVKRVEAAIEALTGGRGGFEVRICQLVRFFRAGETIKMSKRAGNFVTLRDVVDEVGSDSVRFMMLYRKNDAPLDFDFAEVTAKSRDNPVFYVQYAHARAHSVFRNAAEIFSEISADGTGAGEPDLARLDDEGEIALMKRLALFPKTIENAARTHEPHRIAFYLNELASDFHGQWNRGASSPHLRFIREDDCRLTVARISLVRAVSTVIATGLSLLGVEAPQEMR